MKISLKTCLLSATLLGSAPALAAAEGPYIGLRGGVIMPDDMQFTPSVPPGPAVTLSQKRGWVGSGQLGYDYGRLRTELDVGYQRTANDRLINRGLARLGTDGDYDAYGSTRSLTLMLNAMLDIIQTDRFSVSIGGGAGAIRAKTRNSGATGPIRPFIDDVDWAMALQGLAGVSYALSPSTDFTLDYRYQRSSSLHFAAGSERYDSRIKSHAVMAGLRFRFGGGYSQTAAQPIEPVQVAAAPALPAPPVYEPPVSAPMPAPLPSAGEGPFLVFFDFDSATLSPEARAILDQVASQVRNTGSSAVQIEGYSRGVRMAGFADTSGAPPYNVALSEQRVQATKAYLAGTGIAEGTIMTEAFGENRPRVATGDGVREPQNRRVEIQLAAPTGQ